MKLLFTLYFLFFSIIIYTQESPHIKFGEVTPEELNMKYDLTDSSAEAVLLYENETIHFESNNYITIHKTYQARIKILKSSGLDRGNISLPYHRIKLGDNEKIYDIEGFVYNIENGKQVSTTLPESAIFDEKVSDVYYIKKIIMPNVKEGSVIEYRYKQKTPFSINTAPSDWYFQSNIPFKWSEINIIVPIALNYRIMFGGYVPLYIKTTETVDVDYKFLNAPATKYRFVVKDAPAFKDESFISTRKDFITKVEFEMISYNFSSDNKKKFSNSWQDISKFLNNYERFGVRLEKSNYLKDVVNSLLPITDTLERINSAFSYVNKNFAWNNKYSVYADEDLKKVFGNKKGSSSELNLLLVVLLRELGITADPVIISTRANGEIKEEYPMLDKFNYTIAEARVNGKDILMDATEPFSIPGLLPERCLNTKGCLVGKDSIRMVSLLPAKSTSLVVINATLDSLSNKITGSYSAAAGSYYALGYRHSIKSGGEKELLSFYKKNNPDWQFDTIHVENKDDPFLPFKLDFNFTEEPVVTTTGKLYLNPLFSEIIKENPFKSKDRYYPVNLPYPYEQITVTTLKIPKNYTIAELPKNTAIALPDKGGKFSYIIESENNIIKIKSRILIDRSFYSQTEYHYLREFYSILIQKQAEQIILKKS